MKKVLCLMVAIMLVAPMAFADKDTPENEFRNIEWVQNKAYSVEDGAFAGRALNSVGTLTTHRIRNTKDRVDPALSSGVAMTTYENALIYVDTGGTTPGWSIRPYFYNTTAAKYIPGVKRIVSGDEVFVLPVKGQTTYISCDDATGTSPTITIYVQPTT